MRGLAELLGHDPLRAEIEFVVPFGGRRRHRAKQLLALGRSLYSTQPAKALFTRSRRFQKTIARRLSEEHFDLLMLNGSDLLWLLDELPARPPTLLLAFNLEHELYRSQIRGLRAPWPLRSLLVRDLRKLRSYETRGLADVGRVLFLSGDEAARHPRVGSLQVPPLFAYPRFAREPRESPPDTLQIGFLGNFEWWPNQKGLDWFVRRVLPFTGEAVHLHVFGRDAERFAPDHPRLHAHGFVPDLGEVWKRCDFMICPIADGAGVNVKLAEALYNGIPVLARGFATRGLGLAPDPSIVIRDTADEWVALLGSADGRRLATQNVPGAVSQKFSADHHRRRVQSFVLDAARANGAVLS